jgi:nucleoside-diphosphate-sugar epimerase
MATLLIIGGSGFFGKSILDSYSRGLLNIWGVDQIIVMARNAEKLKESNPELMGDSIKLLNDDISKCIELPAADYVIHGAASTDAANYLNRPEVEKNNIQAGTYNYCELAKKFHHNSRIVYCSSGAVYGQQPTDLEYLLEEFDGGDVNEMSPVKRDYAAAKRDGERAIRELGSEGRNVSIARCFAFVGKYLPRDQHFAIGNFIEDGLQARRIRVNATKSVYRSYMYADDLVEWLMTIAYSSNPECPIYNVGSCEAIEIRGLAKAVGNFFGVNVNASEKIGIEVDRYIPSVEKAFEELGLKTKYDLSSAIAETVKQIKSA